MTRVELAISMHDRGFACSQAVVAAFAGHLGMPPATAARIACGFGGGIGRLGASCGAITGGVMALSLALGSEKPEDQDAKLGTYSVVADFVRGMEAFAGAADCRSLLGGLDLWKEEDRLAMKEGQLSARVCSPLIAEAVYRVERILIEAGKLSRKREPEPEAVPDSIPNPNDDVQSRHPTQSAQAQAAQRFDMRPARKEDAPVLARFLYTLLTEVMPPADWSAKREAMIARSIDYFERGVDSPTQANFLVFAQGVPVGCICMVIEERAPHLRYDGCLFGYVHNVYVVPEHRGRGLARALVRHLHEEAQARGIVRIGLHSSRFGRPLYVDEGYESVERYMESEVSRKA